jgi:hypothetical protein
MTFHISPGSEDATCSLLFPIKVKVWLSSRIEHLISRISALHIKEYRDTVDARVRDCGYGPPNVSI